MNLKTTQQRIYTIDSLRLLAAFCVVAIHAGGFQEYPSSISTAIKILLRWAVPFFFLVTGYFLGGQETAIERKIFPIIVKILWMFLFGSILYIPKLLFFDNLMIDGLNPALSLYILMFGTSQHLWFLNSMIVGIFIVSFFYYLNFEKYLNVLSIFILCMYVFIASYGCCNLANLESLWLARHLSSIPMIYIGTLFTKSQINLSKKSAILITFLGFLLQFIENYFLFQILGRQVGSFSIGTIFCAIGILGIGLNLKKNKPDFISKLGQKYSAGIYIIHVQFMLIIRRENSTISTISVFGLCLLFLWGMELFFPTFIKLLNGDVLTRKSK